MDFSGLFDVMRETDNGARKLQMDLLRAISIKKEGTKEFSRRK